MLRAKSAQSLGARKVVGVDIDESLITAAWKRRRSAWSQQEPSNEQSSVSDEMRTTAKRKRSESHSRALRPDHFPASSEHMFGPLPIPTQKPRLDAFPQNLIFKHADWVTTEIAEDAEGYGVVVAYVTRLETWGTSRWEYSYASQIFSLQMDTPQ